MNFIVEFEKYLRLLLLGFLDLRRWPVLVPLLFVGLVHGIVLVLLALPVHPLWGSVTAPLIESVFGESYLHYPQSWIGLPVTVSGVRIVVDLLLFPVLSLWAIRAARCIHERHRPRLRDHVRDIVVHGWFAFGLVVFSSVVWVALYTVPVRMLFDAAPLSSSTRSLVGAAWGFFPAVVLAPLFLVLAVRMDRGGGPLASVRDGWRGVRPYLLVACLFSATPWVAGLPLTYALNRSAAIAVALRPEVIGLLTAFESGLSILALYLVGAAAARIWISEARSVR